LVYFKHHALVAAILRHVVYTYIVNVNIFIMVLITLFGLWLQSCHAQDVDCEGLVNEIVGSLSEDEIVFGEENIELQAAVDALELHYGECRVSWNYIENMVQIVWINGDVERAEEIVEDWVAYTADSLDAEALRFWR